MIGHQMAAAPEAILPLGEIGLLVGRQVLGAGGHLDVLGPPEREGVDRAAGPGPARAAVTVAHRLRSAARLDLHRAAETLALVGHLALLEGPRRHVKQRCAAVQRDWT